MKSFLPYLLLITLFSCSKDPNQVYIDKVEAEVKKNDLGLNIGYRNIEFKWVDTISTDGVITAFKAENTYRMMVGEVDQKVTAIITFDPQFNVVAIE